MVTGEEQGEIRLKKGGQGREIKEEKYAKRGGDGTGEERHGKGNRQK